MTAVTLVCCEICETDLFCPKRISKYLEPSLFKLHDQFIFIEKLNSKCRASRHSESIFCKYSACGHKYHHQCFYNKVTESVVKVESLKCPSQNCKENIKLDNIRFARLDEFKLKKVLSADGLCFKQQTALKIVANAYLFLRLTQNIPAILHSVRNLLGLNIENIKQLEEVISAFQVPVNESSNSTSLLPFNLKKSVERAKQATLQNEAEIASVFSSPLTDNTGAQITIPSQRGGIQQGTSNKGRGKPRTRGPNKHEKLKSLTDGKTLSTYKLDAKKGKTQEVGSDSSIVETITVTTKSTQKLAEGKLHKQKKMTYVKGANSKANDNVSQQSLLLKSHDTEEKASVFEFSSSNGDESDAKEKPVNKRKLHAVHEDAYERALDNAIITVVDESVGKKLKHPPNIFPIVSAHCLSTAPSTFTLTATKIVTQDENKIGQNSSSAKKELIKVKDTQKEATTEADAVVDASPCQRKRTCPAKMDYTQSSSSLLPNTITTHEGIQSAKEPLQDLASTLSNPLDIENHSPSFSPSPSSNGDSSESDTSTESPVPSR